MKLDIERVISQIRGDYSCLILFGSYSRGDFESSSDIDIAQISEKAIDSYTVNEINVSIYNNRQLLKMAANGSLFLYHLITEGKVIAGDKNFLEQLRQRFVKPENYKDYKSEIKFAAKVLHINRFEYLKDWKGFNSLALYLFRSYLYADMFDAGTISFSIKEISKVFKDPRIIEVFKNRTICDYEQYLILKSLFEYYAKDSFYNEDLSISELLKNEKENHKLMAALALHFLNKDVVKDIY